MSLYGRVILGNFAHPTLQRGEHKAQGLLHLQHPQHHLQHLQHHHQHLQHHRQHLQHHLQHFKPLHLHLSNECAQCTRTALSSWQPSSPTWSQHSVESSIFYHYDGVDILNWDDILVFKIDPKQLHRASLSKNLNKHIVRKSHFWTNLSK